MLMRARDNLSTPRLGAAAAHLDAGVSRHAELTTAEILRAVDGLVGELERERNRLALEAATVGIFTTPAADGARSLLESLERFMFETVRELDARIKAAAEPEARALAVRLHNAAVRILASVRGFSVTDELLSNVARTVEQTAADVRGAGKVGSGVVVAVAVVVLALVIAGKV